MKSTILLLITSLFCISITMTSCDKEESQIIEDPDDNTCGLIFPVAHLNVSVDENTGNDTEIGELMITVENSNQEPTIELSNITPAGAIALSGNKIIVADESLFDYEMRQQITATATATVDCASATGDITIDIQDMQEATVHVENFTASIDENSENGTEIGVLAITVENTNEAANVVLRNVEPAGAISLNGTAVEVADESLFDYETRQQITAQVEVSAAGVSSTADITINLLDVDDIISFNDATFKAWLANHHEIDSNNDGEITVSEAAAFNGTIDCTNNNMIDEDITNVEEIKYFVNLTRLHLFNNAITEIDLSNNTKIKILLVENNGLTSIDISMLPELVDFKCHSNNLTSANIANGNNVNMTRMDLRANPDLTCIQVDNANSDRPSSWKKDSTASYSNNCN